MVDIGNRLKTLRLQKNMSQPELASKLGVTKSAVSAYENGSRNPSYDVLIHISKIFKVSTDYLLGQDPPDPLDVSGLSQDAVYALIMLIKAMRNP